MIGYIYIFLAVTLTVYAQLIFKWRISSFCLSFPTGCVPKIKMLLGLISDPYLLSGYFSLFLVSLMWIWVLKKFPLSYANIFSLFPFVGISFFSYIFFGETFNGFKIFGSLLVIIGILIVALKG
jgi:drug/metabolite transporter (DMT)-like permease